MFVWEVLFLLNLAQHQGTQIRKGSPCAPARSESRVLRTSASLEAKSLALYVPFFLLETTFSIMPRRVIKEITRQLESQSTDARWLDISVLNRATNLQRIWLIFTKMSFSLLLVRVWYLEGKKKRAENECCSLCGEDRAQPVVCLVP